MLCMAILKYTSTCNGKLKQEEEPQPSQIKEIRVSGRNISWWWNISDMNIPSSFEDKEIGCNQTYKILLLYNKVVLAFINLAS